MSWILGLNKRKGGGSQPCTSICSFLLLDCRHKVTNQFMLKLPQLGAVLVTVTLPSLSQQTVTSNHKPQTQLQFSAFLKLLLSGLLLFFFLLLFWVLGNEPRTLCKLPFLDLLFLLFSLRQILNSKMRSITAVISGTLFRNG